MLPDDIKIGHCYKTDNNQHRRVVAIEDGHVRYYSRGGNTNQGWEWGGGTKANPAALQTFADAVVAEIDCPAVAPPPGYDLDGQKTES